MSILEVELEPEITRRLQEAAAKRGLLATELVRAAVNKLLESENDSQPKHSIMELEGLGAEIWRDKDGKIIDAQDYVNDLRREWDHRQ